MKTTNSKASRQKFFKLLKDYYVNSDEKFIAWLHLAGIVLSVIALVALLAAFAAWSVGFWAILTAKTVAPFLMCMAEFAGILAAYVGVSVVKNYLMGNLSLRWRNWLSKKIIAELTDDRDKYLGLSRSKEIDNVEQRIQEDVRGFVDLTLNLGAGLLQSITSLATFAGILWVVGGALAIGLNVVIPGYLVWMALIIAIAASVATHFIGKSLSKTNRDAEHAEAELRNDLKQLTDDAENIAEEHAKNYYKRSIESKVLNVKTTSIKKLNTQTKLTAFQSFYMQLSGILPYIFAAPLYFSGSIAIGQLMQIGMAFGQVSESLSLFVNFYENIAEYKASVVRIGKLQKAIESDGSSTNARLIQIKVRNKEWIRIKRLNINKPDASSPGYIMRDLALKLMPGESTLIKAPSGLGKSTLFKAIAGTWDYGDGKIAIPAGKSIYILPQKPSLTKDTLRAVLAYPDTAETYSDDQYVAALQAVGGMDGFIPKLSETRCWSKELSCGQQQRISFARALLKKPDWLFLDEATSSLDEEAEDHVYRELGKLKNTTVVSIAHRSTVEKHHARVVYFHANQDREISVEDNLTPSLGGIKL